MIYKHILSELDSNQLNSNIERVYEDAEKANEQSECKLLHNIRLLKVMRHAISSFIFFEHEAKNLTKLEEEYFYFFKLCFYVLLKKKNFVYITAHMDKIFKSKLTKEHVFIFSETLPKKISNYLTSIFFDEK